MHIRFLVTMNIQNWFGLDDRRLVPLIELTSEELNGDHLLEVEGERLLVQSVPSGYRLKMSSPNRGFRTIGTFDYQGLIAYGEANGFNTDIIGAPAVAAAEEEKPKVFDGPTDTPTAPESPSAPSLFPEIAQFLSGVKKKSA